MNGPDVDLEPEASPLLGGDPVYKLLWGWVAVLFRRRGLILAMALLAAAAVTLRGLLRPRLYVSQASFVAQSEQSSRSSLGSLLASTGINLPNLTGGSIFFYAELVRADTVLRQVAGANFDALVDGGSGALADILEIEARTPRQRMNRMDRTVGRLRQAITIRTTTRPQKVSFSVEMPRPDLSLAVAEMLLEEVARFNVRVLQSQGRTQRELLEERLEKTERSVREWEDSLQAFLASNRDFGDYSQQRFEHDRLLAELQRHRGVYSALSQNREQALLTEAREGSTITVLRSPRLPVRSKPRVRKFLVFVGAAMGAAAGVFCVVAAELLSRWNAISAVRRLLPPSSVAARLLDRAIGARVPRAPS